MTSIMKLKKLLHDPYFMIVATYVLAHSFMLILSGCWWDDWTFMSHNMNYIRIVAQDSGRPEWLLLVPLCWSLPQNGRILIYFLYLGISIFVYRILKDSELFSEEDSLMIALLFSVVPVNDARLLISNFAYTVGLFLFYLGFMLFVRWNKTPDSPKKTIGRILLLGLFFLSYILNSVLVFYYIVIAYLFLYKLKTSLEDRWIRKILLVIRDIVIHYFDFCILPFVNFILNKLFLPVSGVFVDRNVITVEGLISSIDWMPWSVIKVFQDVFAQFRNCINPIGAVILAFILLFLYLTKKRLEDHPLFDSMKYLVYGMTALVLALFPYIVVRVNMVETTGVKGRDAVLVPLGFAFSIYAFLILIKGKYRRYLMGIVLTLMIFSCNLLYLEWQKDYYYQLALEELLDDPFIAENDTFFVTELNETGIEAQRYYSLNTNAYHVYGDETRLFIPKVSNLNLLLRRKDLENAKNKLDHAYMMKDYDPEDYCLDAVLDFHCDLTDAEVLQLKYLEMTDEERFQEHISSLGSLDIYAVGNDFTTILLDGYKNNTLKDDEGVLELLFAYLK